LEDLEALAQRFDLATRAARIAVWDWNVKTSELNWSPMFLEILSLERSDFKGQVSDFFDRVVPEDRERVTLALDRHFKEGAPYDVEYEMFRGDGRRVTVAATGQASFDDSGQPAAMVGTVQDVTERSKLEDQLLAAEQIAHIGHWLLDVPSGQLTWSPEMFRIHGLDPEDRQPSVEEAFGFYHPDDVETVSAAFTDVMVNGNLQAVDVRLKLDNGDVRHVHVDGVATLGDDGEPRQLFGIVHDRTEIIRKEEQLKRSERLESIGRLVGGVAHDFNNLMAVIHGNLELLQEHKLAKSLSKDEREAMLSNAISACRRGAELTRSLLAFARKSHLEPQHVDINDAVRETNSLLARALPATIEMDLDLGASGIPVRLDPTRLQSALVNTIVNARDAMPDGGRLTIRTAVRTITNADASTLPEDCTPGSYCTLSVSDTGTGIAPALLPKIFEPFITSKAVGEGSGLGLSMVQGFVTQSGGFVTADSEQGAGTCITMYFPQAEPLNADEPLSTTQETQAPRLKQAARILVVEDQLEVLTVVVRSLKSAGYEVDAANNGEDADRRFSEQGNYDLLLTDVVMPGRVNGHDLAKLCRQRRPDLPIVFMTGYESESMGIRGEVFEGEIHLTKPIPRQALLDAVQRALE